MHWRTSSPPAMTHPHGATLAVVFPAWMEYVMDHDVNRFAQIAVRVWGCDMDYQHPDITARYGIRAFRAFLKMVGMPTEFCRYPCKRRRHPRTARPAPDRQQHHRLLRQTRPQRLRKNLQTRLSGTL